MKIIAKKTRTVNAFIWMIAICMSSFFGLYKYFPFSYKVYFVDYMYIGIILCSLVFLIVAVIKYKNIKIQMDSYMKILLVLCCLIFIEIILTYIRFNQPISLVIKEGVYYISPFIVYFVFLQISRSGIEAKKICDIFVEVSIICSIIAIIAFVLYTYLNINILRLSTSSLENFRNGSIRFGIGINLVCLASIISITRIISKEINKLDIYNLILAVVHVLVINKTRTLALYLLTVIIISFLLNKKTRMFIKVILSLGLVICFFFICFSADTISSNLVSYFNTDVGILIRFKEISYYYNQFVENPLFGTGLISTNRDIYGWKVLYGANGQFYREDVGIIGLLSKFGIFGVVWIVLFIRLILNKQKQIKNVYSEINKNIIIYYIISLINLSFMDFNRIIYIIIVLMISKSLVNNSFEKCACKYSDL